MPVPPGCAFLIEPVPDDVFVLEDFGEEQRAMARTAEEFVDREVIPRLDEIEEKKEGVMPELLRRAGELGLLMIDIPEAYGGLGLDKTTSMLVSERAAMLRLVQHLVGRAHRHRHAADRLLRHRGAEAALPAEARDRRVARGVRAHRAGLGQRRARREDHARGADGDHWVLTGTKQFITNAGFADLFTVFAKVDGEKFTAFLVERARPGRRDRPRGAEARHRGLVDAPAHPRGRARPRRPAARRDRPGPQDRLQHPQHRPLQARRRRASARRASACASRSTTRASASSSASRSRASA